MNLLYFHIRSPPKCRVLTVCFFIKKKNHYWNVSLLSLVCAINKCAICNQQILIDSKQSAVFATHLCHEMVLRCANTHAYTHELYVWLFGRCAHIRICFCSPKCNWTLIRGGLDWGEQVRKFLDLLCTRTSWTNRILCVVRTGVTD